MSLVGTRPPTVDEWDKYELHHRARLATKPGLTGMWQVSGRSNITDFEEVVKLDKQYISEWTIEDEIMTAELVKEALHLNGIGADIAEDGLKGLELIKKKDYDLILLDLKMPKLSGEEVLKEIRKIRPYVFVIIYTNFSEFADIKALVNIGIDGYVNKGPDSDLQELIDKIKEKLEPFSISKARGTG